MDSDALLDRLLEREIFAIGDDGGVRLSEPFRERLEEAPGTAAEATEWIEAEVPSEKREAFTRVVDRSETLVPMLYAVYQHDPELPADALPRVLLAIDQTRYPPERTDGVPEPLLPIRGDRIPPIVDLFRRSVVYVWKEDCDPCDVVRANFEDIFEEPPEDVLPLAVYGPAQAELLYEEYEVGGSPTILFLIDGRVDTRLVGPHATTAEAVEHEIGMLRELTS